MSQLTRWLFFEGKSFKIKTNKGDIVMYEIRATRKTKQFELLNEAGEVAQKTCRSCQRVKLAEEFSKYSEGHLRPDCLTCNRKAQREYLETIKDKRIVYRQRARAVELGLPSSFSEEDFKELKAVSNGFCMISGLRTKLQVDHLQAISKGFLGSTKGNLILVSETVNQAKRDMSLFEFLKSDRSKGLVDKEQLKRTLHYLAVANGMTLAQYVEFLKTAEELAYKNKAFWEGE